MSSNPSFLDGQSWNGNKEFLNYPGLQYLFYTKLKPMIHDNVEVLRQRVQAMLEDDHWVITYDEDNGVRMTLSENNRGFFFDQDGSCGSIDPGNGMLQLVTEKNMSYIKDGYIDSSIYGENDASGTVHVNFEMPLDS